MQDRAWLAFAVALVLAPVDGFHTRLSRTWCPASSLRGLVAVSAEDLSTAGEEVACGGMPDVTLRRVEPLTVDGLELADGESAHVYWMKVTASGATTTKYMKALEKDAAANANFPGFRKGKVPPFIQQELKRFCLETVMNDGLMDVLEAAEITALEDDNKYAEIHENFDDMFKVFKVGAPVTFTATVHGKEVGPASALGSAVDSAVIDAEVLAEVTEELAAGAGNEA